MILATALLLATIAAPAPAAAQADVNGKWDGTVTATREDGSTSEDTVLLVLDQKDTKITGTIGGSDTDQHPITSGSIDGNKVVILAKHTNNEREFRLELTLESDELKGIVTSGTRKGTMVAKKRK